MLSTMNLFLIYVDQFQRLNVNIFNILYIFFNCPELEKNREKINCFDSLN